MDDRMQVTAQEAVAIARREREGILAAAARCGIGDVRIVVRWPGSDSDPDPAVQLVVEVPAERRDLAIFEFAEDVEELTGRPTSVGTGVIYADLLEIEPL